MRNGWRGWGSGSGAWLWGRGLMGLIRTRGRLGWIGRLGGIMGRRAGGSLRCWRRRGERGKRGIVGGLATYVWVRVYIEIDRLNGYVYICLADSLLFVLGFRLSRPISTSALLPSSINNHHNLALVSMPLPKLRAYLHHHCIRQQRAYPKHDRHATR